MCVQYTDSHHNIWAAGIRTWAKTILNYQTVHDRKAEGMFSESVQFYSLIKIVAIKNLCTVKENVHCQSPFIIIIRNCVM